MNIETHHINVQGIRVEVVRKPIKNLHLGVYPPNGRVRVAVPLAVNDDAVRLAVVSKLGWIKKQQAKFDSQIRQSAREYVTGESHYYLGRHYRLNVVESSERNRVALRNGRSIDLYIRKGSDLTQREKIVQGWYRKELKALALPLIEKWAVKLNLPAPRMGIKRMKTKWGSCSPKADRIWINLELIKKPTQCLEFIIVHEMVHFFERHHNERFLELMDQFMPLWRLSRDELNAAPLSHENWKY